MRAEWNASYLNFGRSIMKNFASVFNQFLSLVPRSVFRACVDRFQGDYRTRVFNCWSQFGVMLYAQLTGKTSLRDLIIGFCNKANYFYHLGLRNVARSTVADANKNRNWQIYESLFTEILLRCRDLSPKHKFRFKNNLESLDATTVDLCLESFPWAQFRQTKGAIKIHTKLDHSGQIPSFVNISDGKTHEIRVARALRFEPNSILVVDRAYIDYKWLHRIHQHRAFWVTRLKSNMVFATVINPEHILPKLSRHAHKSGVLKDQIIRLAGNNAGDLPIELRLVVYKDLETGTIYEYLTNIFHLAALTIAKIYKSRWNIEIFFKWIKQNLKIKTFIGTTENAVRTQIWIAMITYLLLSYLKYKTKCQFTLLEIQRYLRENIFARVSLNSILFLDSRARALSQCSQPADPNQVCLKL